MHIKSKQQQPIIIQYIKDKVISTTKLSGKVVGNLTFIL